ncbi:MAG: homocysteine S-methyltransferase family protein [Dinoroseobacter sp.]|nr:homocysteine S-methyltransferase family protein [Dinoroseobacter sp.]
MSRYENLMQRLRDGQRIVIDGGTGSEVERRGAPKLDNAWSGGGALDAPEIVREIHEDYIREGAEIIISNTFSTARNTLQDAGAEEHFEALNRRAVELACEARRRMDAPHVLVAGGISYWSFVQRHPPLEELADGIAAQAGIMKDAGADLLMLEMMVDIDRMLVTLDAARSSGLPVWVGLSCKPNESGEMCLYNGAPLAVALEALADKNVPLVNIMHTDVVYIDACLDIVAAHWDGLVGVYAHSGVYTDGQWVFDDTITPAGFAHSCAQWANRKVHLIGGCCGIRPDHMAAVKAAI